MEFSSEDNHLVLLEAQGTTLREACRKARERLSRQFRICVEVENFKHIEQALDGGADMLLLDNMPPALVQEAVDLIKGKAHIEVSGGITLENVREYAATGVDSISIGAPHPFRTRGRYRSGRASRVLSITWLAYGTSDLL